jgi:hypothetical protein
MNRLPRRWAAAALFTFAAPLTAHAQSTMLAGADSAALAPGAAPGAEAQSGAPVVAGPTLASATAGVRASGERPVVVVRSMASEDAVPNAVPPRGGARNATTLMIVGGAAFIAGAIIGDAPGTIIMVGGAGVGLYGLYLYLQ